jgi:hypothetical protein
MNCLNYDFFDEMKTMIVKVQKNSEAKIKGGSMAQE